MVEIKKNLVSEDKYSIKCPYEMTPEFVVVHNTANDAPAVNEIAYMIRNDNQVSFHYAVDDNCIVQGIPTNRNTWNAGDGVNGNGNRKGIAIEICYSKSGGDRFIKAEQNAAEFIASILKEKGWGIEKVKKHQDFNSKYCPHRTLDMGWDRFLKMIESYMETKPVEPIPEPSTKYNVGDNVSYHTIYASSSSEQALKPIYKNGIITKIVSGAKNPYLIGNGTGWINDNCIIGNTAKVEQIKVGDNVKPLKAISYDGVKLASFVLDNIYPVIELVGKRAVLGNGLNTAFNIDDLKKM